MEVGPKLKLCVFKLKQFEQKLHQYVYLPYQIYLKGLDNGEIS